MKILYLSCHGVLEADEIRLFHALGHTVFSPSTYLHPDRPTDDLRPALPGLRSDPADREAWLALPCADGEDRRDRLTAEFARRFDVVIVMHLARWVVNNAAALGGRVVVWRTIGQSFAEREAELRPYRAAGLRVVRYSPRERTIPGYLGEDAVIRFAKDPDEFCGWTGHVRSSVTVNQATATRGVACNYEFYAAVVARVPHKLFGPGNAGVPNALGPLPYDRLRQELRDNRCYFSVGSYPASYTLNFVEAWMTGTPVVAVGPRRGNSPHLVGHALYEVPDLIEQGVSGYSCDDAGEAVALLTRLLDDGRHAAEVSRAGRAAAVRHFGTAAALAGWRQFFAEL